MWIINDWYPAGDRIETIAPEGSFKTTWGAYKAVCISSGNDCLGHRVKQGAVVIVDNETPKASLENHLNRFSEYFGFKAYTELPIFIYPRRDFVFDRKTELDKLTDFISKKHPVCIILDSLLSMLPLGTQRNLNENSSNLGGVLGRDLAKILSATADAVTDLNVHTKKSVGDYDISQITQSHVQSLVRGHSSIVGQGADSCLILKKISEHPAPTRFCIITRSRRTALPMDSKITYVEMKEQSFGHGAANLQEIDPMGLPPSKEAKQVYLLLRAAIGAVVTKVMVRELALLTKVQVSQALDELVKHKAVIELQAGLSYQLNPNIQIECNKDYLHELNK
jgi:hypothetical protein